MQWSVGSLFHLCCSFNLQVTSFPLNTFYTIHIIGRKMFKWCQWKWLESTESTVKCWRFCPCGGGGSHSPISWKKYPFLDIPEGGASARAKQRKTVITELNLGNSSRPGREQLFVIIFTQQLLVWGMLWIQICIIFRPLSFRIIIHTEKICAFKDKSSYGSRTSQHNHFIHSICPLMSIRRCNNDLITYCKHRSNHPGTRDAHDIFVSL